jgi:hypothetical protein
LVRNLKEGELLEEAGLNGSVILEWILKIFLKNTNKFWTIVNAPKFLVLYVAGNSLSS